MSTFDSYLLTLCIINFSRRFYVCRTFPSWNWIHVSFVLVTFSRPAKSSCQISATYFYSVWLWRVELCLNSRFWSFLAELNLLAWGFSIWQVPWQVFLAKHLFVLYRRHAQYNQHDSSLSLAIVIRWAHK